MGPHPVLVNCIWRLDEGELESMTTAAAFGNELCRLGRNLIRKDTHHFGSSGLSVGVGLHAYIGSKTKGTRSSYGVYGPKDKRKLEAFNAAGGTVLAAAACAEQALQRRFSDLIWNPTVQDCTNALYKATVGDDDLVTVHPRAPSGGLRSVPGVPVMRVLARECECLDTRLSARLARRCAADHQKPLRVEMLPHGESQPRRLL